MDMEKRERRGAIRNRRGKAGETLAETLAGMLIIGLSSVLFVTMTGAAGRIFQTAEEKYGKVDEIISDAEEQDAECSDSDGIGKISIRSGISSGIGSGSVDVKVDWYGSKDYVLSYKEEEVP